MERKFYEYQHFMIKISLQDSNFTGKPSFPDSGTFPTPEASIRRLPQLQ